EDTETVKRLKEEQKGITTLIETKYDDAKLLGGVVQGVRDGNLGRGTISKDVAVSEGEERLDVLITEIETLLDIKDILDEDLKDAHDIQGEIKEIEEEMKAWLSEIMGEEFN